jgi:glycosyltransferase involved in cell wall biosynthesis
MVTLSMKKENKKRGILVVMSNANGWRNPKIFGGAEIKTISIIDKIEEINWYVIMPNQLYDVFSVQFQAMHLHYLPLSVIFSSTNVIKDLFQGVVYTWKCVITGWKNKDDFDLIYSATTNFSDIFPVKIISLITRKPYIVKYHISIYDEPKVSQIYNNFREEKNSVLDSLIRAILARITIIFLKQAKGVLVVCKYLGKQLENCGVESNKIRLNYNGLDFDKMREFKETSISKKYDVCCIGRIEKNKGLQDIVDVVANLKKKKENLSVVMIGDGSYLKELKNTIQEKGVEKNIVMTGFLGEKRYALLQQSKLFVSPTYAKEGFGLTLLEALFFDVPILAYTHPVFEEIFNQYRMVQLIPRDQKNLELAVTDLLDKERSVEAKDLSMFSLSACAQREFDIISHVFEQ